MKLKQAILLDPLTGAVCDPRAVWQMTDEMLVALAEWLPQWEDEIPLAKERLANGPRVETRDYAGAARLKVKSVDEMEADKMRKVVGESDKAQERPAEAELPATE